MRTIRAPLAALCLVILSACASVPQQIPETMKRTCDLYQQVRPDVIKARAYAAEHWDQIPEDAKPTLLKLDSYLPELDRAGAIVCAASIVAQPSSIKWDDVLSTVVKAAALAAELKAQGAI
jgi:hypothetical protein